jgi:predicted lipoprotein with Yx(FWY)xxD motif
MRTPTTRAAAWTAALFVALAGLLAGGAGATATPLVTTAQNARLHAKILVNRSGLTLYHLSVEHKGHFICTNKMCLSFWHPLVVPKGTNPVGGVALGTVQRPGGAIQVAYRGEPLYTFVQDKKRGDVKGEGFKDVGVWHAATVGTASTSSSGSGSGSGSGGGGYGGGYG